MNHIPLISIAMATHNGAKYITAQLDSILSQTYSNIEIVIVDDASTDKTLQIIREYQTQYNNIKLIQNQSNIGVVKSFTKAINSSSGEYIALSDQDDIWLKYKLQQLVDNIGEAVLIHSDALLIDKNQNLISHSHMQYSKFKHYNNFSDYLLGNNVTGCCCMFKRSFWVQIQPIPDGFYVHDHYLSLMASLYGSIKYYPKALVKYRQHNTNMIGAKIHKYDEFISHLQKIKNSIVLLSQCKFTAEYRTELNNAINYYDALINSQVVSLQQLRWIYKHVPFKKFIGFVLCTFFGKTIAKILYNKFR